MIPQQVDFETKNAKFFEDVEFAGGNTVLDIIFDEKNINIPTGVVGINFDFDHGFVQDTIIDDNTVEQTSTLQEYVSLRISTS